MILSCVVSEGNLLWICIMLSCRASAAPSWKVARVFSRSNRVFLFSVLLMDTLVFCCPPALGTVKEAFSELATLAAEILSSG